MARHLLPTILKLSTNNEGGYSNHPKDPGGPTNHGITQATLSAYLRRKATIQDVKNLTLETANKIYEANYWRPIMGDRLPAGLDYAVFDFGINSGPKRAVQELQAVLRSRDKGVGVDGVMGEKTLAAIEAWDSAELIREYINARMRFFKKLKTWNTFGRGWQYRVIGTDQLGKFRRKPGVLGDALAMVAERPVKLLDNGALDTALAKARDSDISWLAPVQNKAQIGTIGTVVLGTATKAATDYIPSMQTALDYLGNYRDLFTGAGYMMAGLVIGISLLTMIKQIRESRESGGAA